jgi:uncharacterized protein YecE (DUF72 family)
MILIGTSGYSFPDWVGPFYPPGTDRARMLDHYAREFPAVEVNATYYRIPPPSTLASMERKTPPGFEFVVKAHHDMTHERTLDPDMFRAFHRAIEPVRAAGKLHGLLAQFPYAFRRAPENESYLVELKRRLPEGVPLFVEFRHNSWIRDDLFPWMEQEGLGYVSVDEPDLPGLVPPIARATGDTGYVRFHGRNRLNWWRGEGTVRAGRAQGAGAGPVAGSRAARGPVPARAPARTPAPRQDLGPLFTGVAEPGAFAAEHAEPPPAAPRAPSTDRYDYLYSEAELQEWANRIRDLAMKTKKTFVFFNNCHVGQAATGAKLMRRLLEGPGPLAP